PDSYGGETFAKLARQLPRGEAGFLWIHVDPKAVDWVARGIRDDRWTEPLQILQCARHEAEASHFFLNNLLSIQSLVASEGSHDPDNTLLAYLHCPRKSFPLQIARSHEV